MADYYDYICGSEDRYHYNEDNEDLYYALIENIGYQPPPASTNKKQTEESNS